VSASEEARYRLSDGAELRDEPLPAPGRDGGAKATVQQARLFAALLATSVSSAALISNVGEPAYAVAGLLLATLLPGWVTAEAALGGRDAAPEYWLIVIVGASLAMTVAVGAVGAATGDLSRSTLGWSWLAATSLVAIGAAVRGNTATNLPSGSSGREKSASRGDRVGVDLKPSPVDRLGISIVICAYTENRWTELAHAVESALNQTVTPAEVVLVVDHNSELLARARSEFSRALVVPNSQRPGLPGARNSGVLATSSEVVAFIDDDAVADADWLAQLLLGYSLEGVLGVGGKIDPIWSTARPRWFPEEFNWVVGCTYRGIPPRPATVRNLIGANMSMRRSVFDAVGGFRQELGRLEETDLCIRAQASYPGGRWLYWPAARVRHSVTEERASWSFFKARCFAEGQAKAAMVTLTSRSEGLESERNYVRRVLPAGVIRETKRLARFDLGGPARACAIIAGLYYTVVGYLRASTRMRFRNRGQTVDIPRRGAQP
jgi:GT2 family glycosyltransferase